MPILLDPKPTFIAPVQISVPGQPPAKLQLEFRHLDEIELKAVFAAAVPAVDVQRLSRAIAASPEPIASDALVAVMALADMHARGESAAVTLERIVVGWPDGPIDGAGNPVPYSPEALRGLLSKYHAAAQEITRQYLRALTESSLKN